MVREHLDDDGQLPWTVELTWWGMKPSWAKSQKVAHEAATHIGVFLNTALQRLDQANPEVVGSNPSPATR